MAAPVVHFEIHAEDPDRCRAFYEMVFGWATNDVPGMEQQYWLMFPNGAIQITASPTDSPGEGISGGMMKRQGDAPAEGAPVNGYVCVLQVEDLEKTKQAVLQHGGQVVVEPMEIAGVGRVFYAKDTEANTFGVIQPAPSQDAQMLEAA